MEIPVQIRPVTSINEPELELSLNLLNRTQGEGLFDEDYLKNKIQSPNSIVFTAWDGETFVSVACADLLDDLWYYEPFDPGIKTRLQNRKIGSFSTLSVVESYRGRGIGQIMSKARIQWLRSQECDTILGVSWVSGLAHTSNRVFEKTGFRAVKRVEQFYMEESEKHPFDCPGCNHQPCTCAAILYELHLT